MSTNGWTSRRGLPLWVLLTGCSGEEVRPPWVASALGETVYSTACAGAESIPEHERVYFTTRAEAEKTGYAVASVSACAGMQADSPSTGNGGEVAAPSARVGAGDAETSGAGGLEPRAAAGGSGDGDRPVEGPPAAGDVLSRDDRPCPVERIIDGDTLICEGGERVRLLMIDTPERDQEPYGGHATRALEELLRGHTAVRLEFDVQRLDQYGRTLAYLWLADGRMLNEEVARAGYAVALVYPPNVRYDERIRRAVAEAREARRGLWATEAFECLPVDHRAARC